MNDVGIIQNLTRRHVKESYPLRTLQRLDQSPGGRRAERLHIEAESQKDVSAGSARMADGGGAGPSVEMKKERLLVQFRMWRAEGKLGKQVRCPICKLPVNADNFDRHVRHAH